MRLPSFRTLSNVYLILFICAVGVWMITDDDHVLIASALAASIGGLWRALSDLGIR